MSKPLRPHYPNHQSLATLENWAKIIKEKMNKEVLFPGPVKNLI